MLKEAYSDRNNRKGIHFFDVIYLRRDFILLVCLIGQTPSYIYLCAGAASEIV